MYQRTGCGIEYAHDRQQNSKKVDAHGKADAELDGLDGSIGQPLQVGQLGNIITHENNISRIDCDIRSRGDRYAYIRPGIRNLTNLWDVNKS